MPKRFIFCFWVPKFIIINIYIKYKIRYSGLRKDGKSRWDFMGQGKSSFIQSKLILNDHKRVGKRLIPPLLQGINYQDVSWGKHLIPELIWLAIINNHFGNLKGAEIALALPMAANEATLENPKETMFFTVSSFNLLSIEEKERTKKILRNSKSYDHYLAALKPLIQFYPSCPLNFLFDFEKTQEISFKDLEVIKKVLTSMFDRRSVESTFIQADAIYICSKIGKLVVNTDISLAKFPEIQYYPKTDISLKIAASVRATINVLIDIESKQAGFDWPNYFWNHGLELEQCYFN